MIYKEGHKIKRIRIGDNKEVYRVYFNDQIVFKRYHPVTAVVATTHDQWIETDMKDFWLDEMEWEVSFSANMNSSCIFGCRPDKAYQEFALMVTNDTPNGCYFYRCGGNVVNGTSPDAVKVTKMGKSSTKAVNIIGMDHGKTSTTTEGFVFDINKIITASFINKHFYLDGKEYPFTEQAGYPFFLTYLPLHIFRLNQIDYDGGKTADNSNGVRYLYYARFWKKGKIYRDFIPVLDENGNAALYDKVTKKFFYSAGSKPLEYINNKYSPITCIEDLSTTAYTDTGILPKDIGKWELKLQYKSTTSLIKSTTYGFGCIRTDTSGFYFGNTPSTDGTTNNNYKLQIGNQAINTTIPMNNTNEININIDMINKIAKINNQSFSITNTSSLEDLPSLIIGALRNNNAISSPITNMRVYESKIYDKDGKLIQYLKPYIDREQEIGIFYDVLNKIPYNSASSGKFSYI